MKPEQFNVQRTSSVQNRWLQTGAQKHTAHATAEERSTTPYLRAQGQNGITVKVNL